MKGNVEEIAGKLRQAGLPLLAGGLLILFGVLSLPTALLAQVTQAQVRIDGMT